MKLAVWAVLEHQGLSSQRQSQMTLNTLHVYIKPFLEQYYACPSAVFQLNSSGLGVHSWLSRLDEFMAGFTSISMKLKEMYQVHFPTIDIVKDSIHSSVSTITSHVQFFVLTQVIIDI